MRSRSLKQLTHRLVLRVERTGRAQLPCGRLAAVKSVHQRQLRRLGVRQCLLLPRALPLQARKRRRIASRVSDTRTTGIPPSIKCRLQGTLKPARPNRMISSIQTSTGMTVFSKRSASQTLHKLSPPAPAPTPLPASTPRLCGQPPDPLLRTRPPHHQTPRTAPSSPATTPSTPIPRPPPERSSCASGKRTQPRCQRRIETVPALRLATLPSALMMAMRRSSCLGTDMVMLCNDRALEVGRHGSVVRCSG